jgi:hypothetical protein
MERDVLVLEGPAFTSLNLYLSEHPAFTGLFLDWLGWVEE